MIIRATERENTLQTEKSKLLDMLSTEEEKSRLLMLLETSEKNRKTPNWLLRLVGVR